MKIVDQSKKIPSVPIKVLILEDDSRYREFLREFVSSEGLEVETVEDGISGIARLQKIPFHIVLTDLRMPKADGIEVLEAAKRLPHAPVVILFTGYADVESAVKAMKLGAFDYLRKPLKVESLRKVLRQAVSQARLNLEKEKGVEEDRLSNLLGKSAAMQKVFELIRRVARTNSTVLIFGESGTGKELTARAIHELSSRRNHPLVPVNCGAIPEDLLESELFGHEKGAFTGATHTRIGRFELANGGTIFLDEIGDMSPALQVKILRVLQEHEIERVGGVRSISVDIRVIAATHRNLEKAVQENRFREDLYYRLNVIPIELPPLRERKEDIPLLTRYFLARFNEKNESHIEGIEDEAMEYFMKYPWPGNIRELENLVERLVVLKGEGVITVNDLPDKMFEFSVKTDFSPEKVLESGIQFSTAVSEYEKELILHALKKAGGVKNRAAKMLGMNRTTLVEKMKKKKIALESTGKGDHPSSLLSKN